MRDLPRLSRPWRQLDAAERASKQRLEQKQRARALAISESNALAQQLLHDLETGGSLVCPHCHERSDRIRFIDRGTAEKSYFVCGLCGRSFAGIEES